MVTTGVDSRHPLNNPDAGTHLLPDDPREIGAALRAGERCYEVLPYLEARYGKRGEAYTRSDGGFLVTLVQSGQAHVDHQVFWLAGVLANRGMPRWLMEMHLDLLYEELSRAIPDNESRYRKLVQAANRLRRDRWQVLSDEKFQELSGRIERVASAELRNCGYLVVSAVCDEACGVRNAVASLMDWLADPGRFSAEWCAVASGGIADARTLIRSDYSGATS